jgi:hypothetical protein
MGLKLVIINDAADDTMYDAISMPQLEKTTIFAPLAVNVAYQHAKQIGS